MKQLLSILLIFTLFPLSSYAQTSWETDDSEDLADEFSKNENYEFDDFIIYDFENEITFDYDKENDIPIAIENVQTDVLAILDFQEYIGSVYQDDQRTIDGPYGVYKNNRSYTLPRYKRSYQSSGIFHQDGEQVLFALPKSTYGQVQKYKYTTTTKDVKYLTTEYFGQGHYIKSGRIKVVVPDWLELEIKEYNFDGYNIEKSERSVKDGNEITFEFKDMDKLKGESGAPGPTYYQPHLLFIFKSFNHKKGEGELVGSTQNQYNWYKQLVDEIEEDESNDEIDNLLEDILKDANTEMQKMQNIFYWIQDNIRYIAFEDGIAGFKPEAATNVCGNRYGDCKGMANLAKAMLTKAGFDARLTWIGTKRIAYDYSVASLAVDNHMICTVILNGKKYFLDPTETFISVDDYATRIQGRQVLIEDGDNYILEKVPEFDHNHNKSEISRSFSVKDGKLVGHSKEVYRGESKTNILRGYNSTNSARKEQSLIGFVNDGNKNLSATNIKTSDLKDRSKTVEIDYDYTLNHSVIDVGNELYVQLDYDQSFYYFDFEEDRLSDYHFSSKYHKVCTYEFQIPAGYKLKHLPMGFNASTDDYSIEIETKQEGGKVVLVRTIIVPEGIIHKKSQEQWNKDQKKLRAFYDDYLVLEK